MSVKRIFIFVQILISWYTAKLLVCGVGPMYKYCMDNELVPFSDDSGRAAEWTYKRCI